MAAVITEAGFSRLLMLGLISKEECEAALAHPYAGTLASDTDLAEQLIWMGRQKLLTYAELEARANDTGPGLAEPAWQQRAGIVEKALHILSLPGESDDKNACDALLVKAQGTESGRVSGRSLPSGRILALAASCVLLVGGCLLYYFPITVPKCTDSGTVDQVKNILQPAMPAVGNGQLADFALTQVKEVGYASAHRQRACAATVMVEKEAIPYAFVIGPTADNYGRLGITAADRSIIEARFSQVDDAGEFGSQAEPIGREKLAAAIRQKLAGQRLVQSALPSNISSPFAALNKVLGDTFQEVADVEPLGACRELQAGKEYACTLLIEHNELPFAAFGMRAQILHGEFTFVRDSASKEWRVADDFGSAFELARRNARPATFTGDRRI
jgi:hypothetical protein